MNSVEYILRELKKSKFRSKFTLEEKDFKYINQKGLEVIESHARDFVFSKLSPAYIANDGKQTAFKGHPVFIAQHATATCCRNCLEKWHKIKKGKELTKQEQDYIVNVIISWIKNNIN